jgi:hypothetical protein
VEVPLVDDVVLILADPFPLFLVIDDFSFKFTLFERALNDHVEDGLRGQFFMN